MIFKFIKWLRHKQVVRERLYKFITRQNELQSLYFRDTDFDVYLKARYSKEVQGHEQI